MTRPPGGTGSLNGGEEPDSVRSGRRLPELLAARARRASDVRLSLNAAGGLIAAAVIAAGRPPLWPALLPAAVCFLAYGIWGITDRALGDVVGSPATAGGLRVLRGIAAVAGFGAGIALLFAVLALALGQWIS